MISYLTSVINDPWDYADIQKYELLVKTTSKSMEWRVPNEIVLYIIQYTILELLLLKKIYIYVQ